MASQLDKYRPIQEQKLECHPIQATECIGWATEDTLTIINEEDIWKM